MTQQKTEKVVTSVSLPRSDIDFLDKVAKELKLTRSGLLSFMIRSAQFGFAGINVEGGQPCSNEESK